MKSLLEEEISKANIHSVKDIKEAILVKNEDAKKGADLMIKTDGVNFLVCSQFFCFNKMHNSFRWSRLLKK